MKIQTEYGPGTILDQAQGYTFVWLDDPIDRYKDGGAHRFIAINDHALNGRSLKQGPFERLRKEHQLLNRKR